MHWIPDHRLPTYLTSSCRLRDLDPSHILPFSWGLIAHCKLHLPKINTRVWRECCNLSDSDCFLCLPMSCCAGIRRTAVQSWSIYACLRFERRACVFSFREDERKGGWVRSRSCSCKGNSRYSLLFFTHPFFKAQQELTLLKSVWQLAITRSYQQMEKIPSKIRWEDGKDEYAFEYG